MLPLAPGRLSMTTLVPRLRDKASWNSRAAKSVPPPGGFGTSTVIGRLGQPGLRAERRRGRGERAAAAARARRPSGVADGAAPHQRKRSSRASTSSGASSAR